MVMEIASVELHNVVSHIAKQLQGYYVNNVYAVSTESILIKLHHPTLAGKQLIISPNRGIWITKYEFESKPAESFVKAMRNNLERARFLNAVQPAGERIAILEFDDPAGIVKVIGEFFGGGNMIIVDKSDKIVACQKTIKVRHRRIVPGENYALPPSRGIDFFKVSLEDLSKAKESNLAIAKWLGREISLSRKYVEEVLARADVDKEAKSSTITDTDIAKIFSACKQLASSLSNVESKGMVILDNDIPVDFALPDFISAGMTFTVKESFVEALDEALSYDLKQELELSAKKKYLGKIQELDKSLQEQAKTRQETLLMASKMREAAGIVIQRWAGKPANIAELQSMFSIGPVKVVQSMGKLLLRFGDDSIELQESIAGMKISSKLFDEAKRLEAKAKLIEQAEAKLTAQKEEIMQQIQKEEKEFEVRKEPLWFERYRWLKTSEDLLAIGGRDAHSNTAIIRKHLSKNDIVLHAKIVGSPFFVIKDAKESNVKSIEEAARAVVAFSRAWREGIKVADAYWVKPEQVKLQAPTGMFLPKGSFLIEGKKNFIKSIKLEIAVGACNVVDRDTLMAGPVSAIEKHCSAYVILTPENFKATDTAKKVKAELISLLDEEKAQIYKRIPLDDFVRVLPSGGGRITGKGRAKELRASV